MIVLSWIIVSAAFPGTRLFILMHTIRDPNYIVYNSYSGIRADRIVAYVESIYI